MCAMDSDGVSRKFASGQTFCFMTANDTVVEQPLRLENFTATITGHALDFLAARAAESGAGDSRIPWYFLMSYFHVHTPLFTARSNRGRSRGGEFGDNVEELDDSVGTIMAAVERHGFAPSTLVFLTSDNGPYQEEGWDHAGRTTLFGPGGSVLGRLKGGKVVQKAPCVTTNVNPHPKTHSHTVSLSALYDDTTHSGLHKRFLLDE